jgi:hypothetical protein
MADDGHGLLAQRHHREGAIRGRIGHDADVRLTAQYGFHHLVGMQALELHARLGIERGELLHRPADVVQADGIDCRHTNRAVDARLDRGKLGLGFLPRLEHRAAGLVQRAALRRDHERPLRAIDQDGADLAFELLHGLAGRRL